MEEPRDVLEKAHSSLWFISTAQKLRNYPFDGKIFSIPSVLHFYTVIVLLVVYLRFTLIIFISYDSCQAAEMEDRIRRKRELQKKAATPATFKESFAKEQNKQAELTKSKEEKRNAMCEELGRGC